jgi:hypothetical protein
MQLQNPPTDGFVKGAISRKHVDYLCGGDSLQKGHTKEHDKRGSEHSHVTTTEKAPVDRQKKGGSMVCDTSGLGAWG